MNSVLQQLAPYLGFVLIGIAGFIAIAVGVVIGGFKCGELGKTVLLRFDRGARDTVWTQMHYRLTELGFTAAQGDGRFLQSGEVFGDLGTFTHAKTNKELRVNFQEAGPQIEVGLSLRYLSFIVYDSGESAYRDAVLNYVSGQTDRMLLVPNRSLLALNSLTGGAVALLSAALILLSGLSDLRPAIWVAALTGICTGLLALFFILRRPAEISGKWLAIIGIIFSAAALTMACVW